MEPTRHSRGWPNSEFCLNNDFRNIPTFPSTSELGLTYLTEDWCLVIFSLLNDHSYSELHLNPPPIPQYLLMNDTLQGRKGLHLLFWFFQGKKDLVILIVPLLIWSVQVHQPIKQLVFPLKS